MKIVKRILLDINSILFRGPMGAVKEKMFEDEAHVIWVYCPYCADIWDAGYDDRDRRHVREAKELFGDEPEGTCPYCDDKLDCRD